MPSPSLRAGTVAAAVAAGSTPSELQPDFADARPSAVLAVVADGPQGAEVLLELPGPYLIPALWDRLATWGGIDLSEFGAQINSFAAASLFFASLFSHTFTGVLHLLMLALMNFFKRFLLTTHTPYHAHQISRTIFVAKTASTRRS